MKVLYLLNKVRTGSDELERIAQGKANDSHFFGMLRLKKFGIDAEYLEIEQFLPKALCMWIRRHVLNIFWVHILLFPKFFRYDVIFSSTAYGSLFLWAVWPFAKPKWVILDFNIIGTIHGARAGKMTLREKMFKYAVGKASGIIAISEKERDDLRTMFPKNAQNIEFFHEATDTEYFKPDSTVVQESFVLSVGRDPGRDFATLIKAISQSTHQVQTQSLVLATKPEALTHLGQLPQNVAFQHFNSQEMQSAYHRAALVVVPLKIKNPLHNDSAGTLVVIEAMAMGKALIVTDNNSVRSYVENGKTGILVPAGDVKALTDAIDDLMKNPEKRSSLGAGARKFAEEFCSADLFAKKLASYFHTLTKV